MKTIALVSILFISACGKVTINNPADFSSTKSTSPVKMEAGSREHKNIKQICDALAEKEITLSGLVGTSYGFSNTSKKCDETSAQDLNDTVVTLVNQGGSFKFQDGPNLFYFADAETKTQGSLSQICASLSSLTSPIRPDSVNLLYFTTTDVSPADCNVTNGEICIMLEKAVSDHTEKGEVGRVHTREWLKFKTIQPLLGFWNYRKLASKGGCLEGNFFARTATLK